MNAYGDNKIDKKLINWSVAIPMIEKALGLTLYEWQKTYLNYGPWSGMECYQRGTGKTTIYCVKLALERTKPIKVEEIWKHRDEDHGSGYNDWFRDFFLEIWHKLKKERLPVVEIIARKNLRGGLG